MPQVSDVPLVSYLDCYPEAVRITSEGREWPLTVNLDDFHPFVREKLKYSEMHICLNVGREAVKLTYGFEDGYWTSPRMVDTQLRVYNHPGMSSNGENATHLHP
jgi:hypothetical protein